MGLAEYTKQIEEAGKRKEKKLADAGLRAEEMVRAAEDNGRTKKEQIKKEASQREKELVAAAEKEAREEGKKILDENKKELNKLTEFAGKNREKAEELVWKAFEAVVSR